MNVNCEYDTINSSEVFASYYCEEGEEVVYVEKSVTAYCKINPTQPSGKNKCRRSSGLSQCQPLLPILTEGEELQFNDDTIIWKNELYSLSNMAAQVSIATVSRMALTSIDSAFLGHIGKSELAASAMSQIWTMAPFLFIWAGSSALVTLCGQSWGAQNGALTGIWLQIGITFCVAFSIPVFAWYWCLGPVLRFTTNDEKIIKLGEIFARTLSFSIFPQLIYSCLREYFQAIHILWPVTLIGVISIGVSLVLNKLLIYGVGSTWKGYGFLGSPLSTVYTSFFQLILLLFISIIWKKHHYKAWGGWKSESFTLPYVKQFFVIAAPIAGNNLVVNLGISLQNLIAARISPEVLTANAVLTALWTISWSFFWGISLATQVKVANYMGAFKPKSAKNVAVLGFCCSFVIVLLLSLIILGARRHLFELYTSDQEILDLCEDVLYWFILSFFIECLEIEVSGILTGMGKVRSVFVISFLGNWVVNLPLSYYFGFKLKQGVHAIWYAVCAMEAFKLICFLMILFLSDFEKISEKIHKQMTNSNESEASQDENDFYINRVYQQHSVDY